METERIERAQWTLDVSVFHVKGFGKRLQAATLGQRGGWHSAGTWQWTGLGVPAALLPDIQARICAVIVEHLTTRYGIQEELPFRWAGEPDAP
jgi:hypothetical protein